MLRFLSGALHRCYKDLRRLGMTQRVLEVLKEAGELACDAGGTLTGARNRKEISPPPTFPPPPRAPHGDMSSGNRMPEHNGV